MTGSRRNGGVIGAAVAAVLLALAGCDDPAGIEEVPVASVPEAVSLAVQYATAPSAAELTSSEIRRVGGVLAALPEAAGLTDALARFEAAVGNGRALAAARVVVRRMDELAAMDAGASVASELDALRLLLGALRFEESEAAGNVARRRLAIW